MSNFINGQMEESQASEWIPLLNPATQEVLCLVPQSTPDELRRAEIGAEEAFKKWREVPVQQRQVSYSSSCGIRGPLTESSCSTVHSLIH